MAPSASLVNKLKVQLKLSISRLRMVQQKDSAKVKQQRREMAQLMEIGKVQSARIRVENIIRSDITTELHEILELYCELLLARSQLLESQTSSSSTSTTSTTAVVPLDPALEEAVRSIIYAAPRTEIKELQAVRAVLVEKFGKEVAVASMEGDGVAERVLKKLRAETPSAELVEAYLSEIARFYGVAYGDKVVEDDGDEDGGAGDIAEEDKELEAALDGQPEDKRDELVKATPPRKLGPQSPLRVMPPSPSTDNVAPKLKLPGAAAAKLGKAGEAKKPAGDNGPGGKIPDVDELSRRFAQLKR